MGKKKDKLLKQAQGPAVPVPWASIDAAPIAFLVAPETPEAYFASTWEQRTALYKATPERRALFSGLCTLPSLIKGHIAKTGPLEFGVDVNAARYRDGVRETPNGELGDAATLQLLHSKEGCTLQVHQPQRFDDVAWRLMAAMERQLGCLVGSNAYLTPAGTQGLAPHHDDVELWVVQTQGSKAWRVYEPRQGFQLPSKPSGDMTQEELGPPIMEVVLEVGDVLYMPRGTVHQATAQKSGDSAHLTISTYQHWSWADLASHLLQVGLVAQAEPECLPLAMRRSPAPGFVMQHSLHNMLAQPHDSGSRQEGVNSVAEALRALADKVESCPDLVSVATQSFAADFLQHRLPPHPKQLPGQGPAPTMEDSIAMRGSGWYYLLPCSVPHGGCVKLVSCTLNSREAHMMFGGGMEGEELSEGDVSSDDGEEGEEEGEEEEQQHMQRQQQQQQQRQEAGHAHVHDGEECCAQGTCGGPHDSDEDMSSGDEEGAEGAEPSGADALPGMVFPEDVTKALLQVMATNGPSQAVRVRDLQQPTDPDKLQLAYALWAEGFAMTVPAARQQQAQQQHGGARPAKKAKHQK